MRPLLLAIAALLSVVAPSLAAEATPPLDRTIEVPLDYSQPALGRGSITYELGAPFDPAKPTVIIVVDGQQFYLTKGSVAGRQAKTFGDAFNVVGILGRGAAEDFQKAALNAAGNVDWSRAWKIFRMEQWIEDIETVRKAVVGPNGKVLLYGASGGADLIHQFLWRHASSVSRAYTASAGNDQLSRQLRLRDEGSWRDFAVAHPKEIAALEAVLAARPQQRPRIMLALQRQHFFVADEDLTSARLKLIDVLVHDDEAAFRAFCEEYQVDAILAIDASPRGIANAVREFEFLLGSGAIDQLGDGMLHPEVEVRRDLTAPLLALQKRGEIISEALDLAPAHAAATEVFVLASRWDEAIDYRVAIALAYSYPHHELFIADDNHVFGKAAAAELQPRLVQAFLRYGLGSPQLGRLLSELESYRWDERRTPAVH